MQNEDDARKPSTDVGPEGQAAVTPAKTWRQKVARLEAELFAAQSQLAECFRLSGADPDGNEDWRIAPMAVAEVRRMREESDANESALSAMRAAIDAAREKHADSPALGLDSTEEKED
jgi:hypothetical protein